MTAYSSLQLNFSTTATLGKKESGRCGDVFDFISLGPIGKVYR